MSNTPLSPALYVIATPIGNLGDVTLRSLDIMRQVAVVYAEDTRVSAVLLRKYDITTPLRSYREAMPRERLDKVIEEICQLVAQGKSVALLSDAGTPGISDPGDYLVRRVRGAGFSVIPIPGASALTTLLSAAGAGVQHPLFEGFLPHKKGRQTRLQQLKSGLENGTMDGIVLFESPERILKLIDELQTWEIPLHAVFGRELTKQFEEIIAANLIELRAELASRPKVKGECVLLITNA
jgi:16S rRNA (cytidine1402-2'-O)-methyltransferase